MKNIKKTVAVAMSTVLATGGIGVFALGCGTENTVERFHSFEHMMTLSIMGDDIFSWNAFSVSPQESFGYVRYGQPSWYSYTPSEKGSEKQAAAMFNMYRKELSSYDIDDLSGTDKITYRTLDSLLNAYYKLYSSKYASEFSLISGSYVTSEGGYVADFATMFENFVFRNEDDVKDLLTVTKSVSSVFPTYAEYAEDREKAGYPLYDFTINGMIDYLKSVSEMGDDYYLYAVADKMIDDADFLTDANKEKYKAQYENAIRNDYMAAVDTLSGLLDDLAATAPDTKKSYLGSYGNMGKAYYEWSFKQKTGMNSVDIMKIRDELIDAYYEYGDEMQAILQEATAYKDTDRAVYDKFMGFVQGQEAILGLTDPDEIIAYLKTAAKNIVPDLKTEPTISFKNMDDTVAQISKSLAYYVRTPIDGQNMPETITINAYEMDNRPNELLTTIAHEGYPGHLYAAVRSKEKNISLLSSAYGCISFSEGWAKYTELAVLESILNSKSIDKATELYCRYLRMYTLVGFIDATLSDIEINYLGDDVDKLIESGFAVDAEDAQTKIEWYSESPAAYVPYGYGMFTMVKLHDKAKKALGDKYDEVQMNAKLLSDGFAPTLARAGQLTDSYIKSAKAKK